MPVSEIDRAVYGSKLPDEVKEKREKKGYDVPCFYIVTAHRIVNGIAWGATRAIDPSLIEMAKVDVVDLLRQDLTAQLDRETGQKRVDRFTYSEMEPLRGDR